MDASSSDRSVEVERTDSVSTLNYRPRGSGAGDTACQKGTRRENKQANRYITGIEAECVQNAIYRSTFQDILWCVKVHLVGSIANILQIASVGFVLQYTYTIFYNVARRTYCDFRLKCFDNKKNLLL